MNKKIITISREFGSGGHEIGLLLSKKLGIPFYDKELLSMAVENDGITEDFMKLFDEKTAPTHMPYIFGKMSVVGYQPTANDTTFFKTAQAMRNIADNDSAIIIGRCADYVLRDYDTFNIFIFADIKSRVERKLALLKENENQIISDAEMEKRIHTVDKQRAKYYEFYTDRKWGSIHNYDICLNTSKINIEAAAETLANILK